MSDIQEMTAKVTEATKALREQIPPQTDYAEMVGAPAWAYGQRFVWDDPSHYAMDNAADLLDDLLAQLAALQAENERLKRNENTICFDDHRFTEGGVRGLLEQIEHDNEVCLEHQQERMELQAENAKLREAQAQCITRPDCTKCKYDGSVVCFSCFGAQSLDNNYFIPTAGRRMSDAKQVV